MYMYMYIQCRAMTLYILHVAGEIVQRNELIKILTVLFSIIVSLNPVYMYMYMCFTLQVFLPGWDTISKLNDMLNSDPMFRSQQKYLIIPLHSMMPTAFQQQVHVTIRIRSFLVCEDSLWTCN